MSIKHEISTDYLTAFKSRDQVAKSILSVVKGEIQTVEKNEAISELSDEAVTKILNKISKSLQETIDKSGDAESVSQLEIVKRYLPTAMTESQIQEKIYALRVSKGAPITIGEVMKAFAGEQVDRKEVSRVFSTFENA